MIKKLIPLLSLCVLANTANLAQAQDAFTKAQEEQIKQLVKSTLLEQPEILQEVATKLQEQAQQEVQKQQKDVLIKNHDLLFNDPNSPRIGANAKDSKATIVYFTDYNCAFCKRYETELKQLQKEHPEVTVIVKPLAFLGAASNLAAEYALTSWGKDPKDFEKVHHSLMDQKHWDEKAISDRIKKENIEPSEQAKNTLKSNMALAMELGIRGTPSTVIGDKVIQGAIEYSQLEAEIKTLTTNDKK